MNNPFSKFEHFGSILNPEKRQALAKAIYSCLSRKSLTGIGFTNENSENFADAINKLIEYEALNELCAEDNELAEKITQEVLQFINSAKREVNTSENPFEKETEVFGAFLKMKQGDFFEVWSGVAAFLKENYEKGQIDEAFYSTEFQKVLANSKVTNVDSFENIKAHLSARWDKLLLGKQMAWELRIIEIWRKKIADDLYRRIDDLKKLKQLLAPFSNELGRLYDMSKGNWQKVNFDVLRRYAEILDKDDSLQRLAEMLGKLHKAEKEYESEKFTNTVIKNKWEVQYASKADLIGIRESDDLSSLLPSETALLSDANLQSVFIKKFAEKKLQTFEYKAKIQSFEKIQRQDKRQREIESTRGPFIICVDTSGSMHGTPETIAKTLCFAILKLAIRERRKCYLISFSTQIETLDLSDLSNSLDRLISFLGMSFYGGTDAVPALLEAIRKLASEDYKKADVLMVSDFVMPGFEPTTREQIDLAKRNNNKFHSLVIGMSGNEDVITEFDNNWFYNPDDPEAVLNLVRTLHDL